MILKDRTNIKKLIESMRIYDYVIAREFIAQSIASVQINW